MKVYSTPVLGRPVQQGSKRWLPNGRMIEHNDAQLRPWRATVTAAVVAMMRRERASDEEVVFPLTGPVKVVIDFMFPRPNYHYGTGRNAGKLRKNAPDYVGKQPDLDKLIRSINDSITDAGLWKDDAQVVAITATKRYGDTPGALIIVTEVD